MAKGMIIQEFLQELSKYKGNFILVDGQIRSLPVKIDAGNPYSLCPIAYVLFQKGIKVLNSQALLKKNYSILNLNANECRAIAAAADSEIEFDEELKELRSKLLNICLKKNETTKTC